MLAFTRKPSDDESPADVELLLDGSDDDLAPLATAQPASDPACTSVATDHSCSTRLIVAPRWTEAEREAYASLLLLADNDEPLFGWRRALFVVSGICVRPSRAEHVWRSRVALLVRSVDPATLDENKEAAS